MTDTSDTLIKAGYAARQQGNAHEAKRLFSEAIAASRASGNEASRARSLTGLGQIERDLNNIPEALQHYRAAVFNSLPLFVPRSALPQPEL